ncbi:MAG TPA: L-lactate permease, partial [Candidatus Sulfotelmatobacter sp.]|nr:L-lactate permease [Candidatus Sulfotelmatobacter sp.]
MTWTQTYDPLHNVVLSTLVAALPIVLLLGSIALLRVRIHFAALAGLAAALALAVGVYRLPAATATAATVYGMAFGLFPIGWIVLNVIFLYQLTVRRGLFAVLRDSLARVAPDPRIQVILIAFSFGAFIEGMAGFGTPVAITAAILIQLGFKPLHASGLALIANTAPVAFGSLGIPITTLEQVTGLDAKLVSAMVGRQLPFFSLLIPFWVVLALAGWRGLRGVWPAALTAGLAFAVPQFLVSNFHGPWLVDPIAGTCSIGATVLLLRFWQPKTRWQFPGEPAPAVAELAAEPSLVGRACQARHDGPGARAAGPGVAARPASVLERVETETRRAGQPQHRQVLLAWLPWAILTGCILCWGTPQIKTALDKVLAPRFAVPHLHGVVLRTQPVAPAQAKPEA